MTSTKISIPSRYEGLPDEVKQGDGKLQVIVKPVTAALAAIDEIYDDMTSASQGAFLVLHGPAGSGKSTFLHTLKLFKEGVRTVKVEAVVPIQEALEGLLEAPEPLRVVVLEGREALESIPDTELELSLHAINQFIRSREGRRTLIVWPLGSEETARRILGKAAIIGGDALLGVHPEGYRFDGPPRSQYVDIARRTIEVLNGVPLLALGITDERAEQLAAGAPTIGGYLQRLRAEERRNRTVLESLLPDRAPHNIWVIVIAGNDPETEVGTLTSGDEFSADIVRLLASTDANVVQDLKRYPEKLGLLGRNFDAKILYVPIMTAMSVIRDFAGEPQKSSLVAAGFSMKKPGDSLARLLESQLALALRGDRVTTRSQGRRPGDERRAEFKKLSQFAAKDDGALNRAMGEALFKAGLVLSYKPEDGMGDAQKRSSDILCKTSHASVRLEFMWRAEVSVGDIARYVLEKLYQYGKAIGYLNGS